MSVRKFPAPASLEMWIIGVVTFIDVADGNDWMFIGGQVDSSWINETLRVFLAIGGFLARRRKKTLAEVATITVTMPPTTPPTILLV